MRIFKFIVTGDENNPGIRPLPANHGGELNAIHARHADVGDDDIDFIDLQEFQRRANLIGLEYFQEAQIIPVDVIGEPIHNGCLIVHYQQVVHGWSPFPFGM